MAIRRTKNSEMEYIGCVVATGIERWWLDGMLEIYACAWDMERHWFKMVSYEYIGADCRDVMGGDADVDICKEVKADMLATLEAKAEEHWSEYANAEINKPIIGQDAIVVRGRKIPKGTKLNVFWMGEKETYMSSRRAYNKEYEMICGCYDEDGNKVWIKAEYLNPVEKISFSEEEKSEWIKRDMERMYKRGRSF